MTHSAHRENKNPNQNANWKEASASALSREGAGGLITVAGVTHVLRAHLTSDSDSAAAA